MEEVHRVAFLTMKGWTLVGNEWTKVGFERSVEKRHGCGCCVRQELTPYFSLDDAYCAQSERDDAPS